MAKLNYTSNHSRSLSNMNNEYWTTPSKGFDRSWHKQKNKQKQFYQGIQQGKHGNHELDVILTEGVHAGKVICKTCDKHVAWIPKYIINTKG